MDTEVIMIVFFKKGFAENNALITRNAHQVFIFVKVEIVKIHRLVNHSVKLFSVPSGKK